MAEHTTTQCLLFPDLSAKPVVVQFDQRQGSSDGGAILLKAADRRLGLTRALAACLEDTAASGQGRARVARTVDAAGDGHRLWV